MYEISTQTNRIHMNMDRQHRVERKIRKLIMQQMMRTEFVVVLLRVRVCECV